jgi:hypothetical protein
MPRSAFAPAQRPLTTCLAGWSGLAKRALAPPAGVSADRSPARRA